MCIWDQIKGHTNRGELFGPRRGEVVRDWGKLYEKKHETCTSREMSCQDNEITEGEMSGADEKCRQYKNFSLKVRWPFRRLWHRGRVKFKRILKEVMLMLLD
jgi:hypothetical protein